MSIDVSNNFKTLIPNSGIYYVSKVCNIVSVVGYVTPGDEYVDKLTNYFSVEDSIKTNVSAYSNLVRYNTSFTPGYVYIGNDAIWAVSSIRDIVDFSLIYSTF